MNTKLESKQTPRTAGRSFHTPALAGRLFVWLLLIATASTAWATKPTWKDKSSAAVPPATRYGHAMADEGNGKLLMFGGYNGSALGDTWEWDGTLWHHLSPQHSPSARFYHAMASEGNGKILLFGGTNNTNPQAGPTPFFNDTWEWDGTDWTQLNPGTSPTGRDQFPMESEGNGKILLFGGNNSLSLVTNNETWEWDSTAKNWTNKTTSGPAKRYGAGMANDGAGKVLLFAGSGDGGTTNYNDTWEWSGSTWTQKAPASSPPARETFGMASEGGGKVLVFGGYDNPKAQQTGFANQDDNDTWEWNGSTWSQKTLDSPSATPAQRAFQTLTYDSQNNKVILFGGVNGESIGRLADLWTWDSANTKWTQATSTASNPSARESHGLADEGGGKFLLFGGKPANNETWEWNGKTATWTLLSPGTSPSGRYWFAMASEGNGKVLLFGGLDSNNALLGDTWEWSGTNWVNKTPATITSTNSPSARETCAMALEGNGKILLFGGSDSNTSYLNDTWEWDGTSWHKLNPSASPPGRILPSMSSAKSGHVLMFGGQISSGITNDTWEWDGSTWTNDTPSTITTTNNPLARVNHAMTYDSTRQRVVLFGGNIAGGYTNDIWEWDGASWTQMYAAGSSNIPAGRIGAAMAFDPTLGVDVTNSACASSTGTGCGGATVLFGGDAGNGIRFQDTWVYFGTPPKLNSLTRPDVTLEPPGNVRFSVAFSEAVNVPTSGNGFSPDNQCVTNSLGSSTCNVTSPSVSTIPTGPLQTYTITVNTGIVTVDAHSGTHGEGTLGLKLTDLDTIRDVYGYPIGGLGTGDIYTDTTDTTANYTIDNLPVVSSVNRVGATPTNAASVQFTVTFNKNVTGVDATDFALATTGVSGASITTVSPNSSTLSQTFTVTVNTGTGDGTIRLDVKDDDSIADPAGSKLYGTGASNPAFNSGQSYTVDKTPPFVSSITRKNPDPTNASSVQYTVTFSEQVTGVDAADFAFVATGAVSGASISNTVTTADNINYTVTVNTGTGDGTVGLNLVDNNTIADLATNILGCSGNLGACDGSFTGQTYTVDKTPPVVSSINRVESSPSNAATVHYTVTFSEAVTGVDKNDFSLAASGVTGASVTSATDSGDHKSYNVVVSTGSSDGTLGLNLVDNNSIADLATNALGCPGNLGACDGSLTGEVFTIDKTPPSVVSINRSDTNPTNAASVTFAVVFSEAVSGVDQNDFALAASGVSGASITNVAQVDASHYTVTVSTGSSDGTLGLNLADDDSIIDAAGNKLGGTGSGNGNKTGQVYNVDHTPPSVASVTRADASPTNAGSVNFNVTFSEAVTGVDAADFALNVTGSISSASITGVTPVDASHYTVAVNTGTGTGTGTIRLDVLDDDSITDPATNPLGGVGANNGGYASGETYSIVPPSLTAHDASASAPQSGVAPMTFTVALSAPAQVPGVTVGYNTEDNTGGAHPATGGASCGAGVDYQTTSGTLTFAAGEQVKSVTVNVCSGGAAGPGATLLLTLSGQTRSTLARAQATGTITSSASAGTILISELRTSGPAGANDDFVELYNNTASDITVPTGGYGLYKMGSSCDASPVLVGTVPAGVTIPAHGHYLLVGSAYSLANYGGTGAASGNALLTADVEADSNLALFSTTDPTQLSTATRLDAVGFGTNAGAVCDLLREGASLSNASGSAAQHSFVRKLATGLPRDTNDNASDFTLVATDGVATLSAARLGAPGPENTSSPFNRGADIKATLFNSAFSPSVSPNRDRYPCADPNKPAACDPNTSQGGYMVIRRTFTNNTGVTVTKLRFRVVDITAGAPLSAGDADLRLYGSVAPSGGANPQPLTLEEPPTQAMRGGTNSTVTASIPGGVGPGNSVTVQFVLGVQTPGSFRFFVIVEALPGPPSGPAASPAATNIDNPKGGATRNSKGGLPGKLPAPK